MTLADDLAKLLNNKSITINVQTGNGATQYNGVTQINNHPQQRRGEKMVTCGLCGKTEPYVARLFNVHFGGGVSHWTCEKALPSYQRWLERKNTLSAALRRNELVLVSRDADDQPQVMQLPSAAPEQESDPVEIMQRDDPAKYQNLPRPYHIPLVRR